MKKQRYNGYEMEAPVNVEASYFSHMRAPQEFMERIALAHSSLEASLDVNCGEMKIKDAAFAYNRVTSIMRSIDSMVRVLTAPIGVKE